MNTCMFPGGWSSIVSICSMQSIRMYIRKEVVYQPGAYEPSANQINDCITASVLLSFPASHCICSCTLRSIEYTCHRSGARTFLKIHKHARSFLCNVLLHNVVQKQWEDWSGRCKLPFFSWHIVSPYLVVHYYEYCTLRSLSRNVSRACFWKVSRSLRVTLRTSPWSTGSIKRIRWCVYYSDPVFS